MSDQHTTAAAASRRQLGSTELEVSPVCIGTSPLANMEPLYGIFDVVLNHNRYTLLDRSAEAMYRDARARGMGVLNAAPYGGGMLSKGPAAHPKYGYRERGDDIRDRALAMQAACEAHGVPLAAAALQFSVRSPLVDSTVVGVSAPERVQQTIDLLDVHIPDALWQELDRLTPQGGWI